MRPFFPTLAALAILLVAVCPVAASDTIGRGVDAFTTVPNGTTYYDFTANPVPAGFFCEGSAPFTGRVTLGGVPLATEVPGSLHGKDTVLERLDDAVFDKHGVAETRVRFRALSMVGLEPIDTGCGRYELRVGLDGRQPVTTMRIYRTGSAGGTFYAPLAVNALLSFHPLTGEGKPLRLSGEVMFPAQPIPWAEQPGPAAGPLGPVVVDTDGDSRPDTQLAGGANFAPGWTPDELDAGGCDPGCFLCEPAICHANEGEEHCTGPVCACGNYNCP